MTIEEKYTMFENILDRSLGIYLKERGFVFLDKKINTSNFEKMRNIHLTYSCTAKSRKIMFSYIPIDLEGEISEFAYFYFLKLPRGLCSVIKILKHEKIDYDVTKFYLLNYKGSFEEKLEQFCDYSIELLDNYFQELLSGEKWFDIPIDWMGYK